MQLVSILIFLIIYTYTYIQLSPELFNRTVKKFFTVTSKTKVSYKKTHSQPYNLLNKHNTMIYLTRYKGAHRVADLF